MTIDEKIEKGAEKALREGITGWGSMNAAERYFGIGATKLTPGRIEYLKSKGLTVAIQLSSSEQKEIADMKLKKGAEKALKEGVTGWESMSAAGRYFGVSASSLTLERIEYLKSKGLAVSVGASPLNRGEDVGKKVLEGAEKALKEGITGWNSKRAAAIYLKVGAKALTDERLEYLGSIGLPVIVAPDSADRAEATDKKVMERANQALEEGITGWDSKDAAIKYLKISYNALTPKRIEFLGSKGLPVTARATSSAKSDENFKEGAKRAIKEGVTEWGSLKEVAKYLGVSYKALTPERIELLESKGLKVRYKTKVSPNTLYAIRKCEELNIQIDAPHTLMELSLDFFSREIRVNNDTLLALETQTSIFKSFKESELEDWVATAAWSLIGGGADNFSILELKLELLKKRVYFSEDRIRACLGALGIDMDESHNNTLEKRFRLAKRAVEYGLVSINYVDVLPEINNCENGNIFIHSAIKKKTSFIKHWKEYSEIMMREDIGGSVSRSPLSENLNIEKEIEKNSARARAYLIDDENIAYLKGLGYEGVAAMILYSTRNAKDSMVRAYHSLAARFMGFFLYLSQKGLAVSHSRFIIYTGGEVTSRIAEYFTKDHVIARALPGYISSSKSKSVKKFHLLSYKFASAVRSDVELQKIAYDDIFAYIGTIQGDSVSGTLTLESFCLSFLRHSGNLNAIAKRADFNLKERWLGLILGSEIKSDTLRQYKTMVEEMFEIIRFRHEDESISDKHIERHMKAAILLLEYLSTIDTKLNRKEMIDVLNPIVKSKKRLPFVHWAKEKKTETQYLSYQAMYSVLFDNLTDPEYQGIYRKAWMPGRSDSSERALVRSGMDIPVLVTSQETILNDAFADSRYPFLRSTPRGEVVDISSWWKYDFSPIPVVCSWLVSKLPRRGKHIRFLDADRFLKFNSDGTIKGLYFNTDKNKKARADKELFIPASLLSYVFSNEEMQLLVDYTRYIQQVYSFVQPVRYDGGKYGNVKPLFPHHQIHDVISKDVVAGYIVKAMIKTQIIVRHNAKEGLYDSYYSASALQYKREYLSTIELVSPKKKYNVPETIEEINGLTVNQCHTRFRLIEGVHNFRHAIATSLAHMGLSIFRTKVFTGHYNIVTLSNVYMHNEEEVTSLLRSNVSSFYDDIQSPSDSGNDFIRKVCMPLVESQDPELVLEALNEHKFLSLVRTVRSGTRDVVLVSNGVELASITSPVSWVSKGYGICPMHEDCPEGTGRVCCLCPYLIFNASCIKAILFEMNDALYDLGVLTAKAAESLQSSRGDSLQKQQTQKMSELAGWSEMFSLARAQLEGEDICGPDESSVPVARHDGSSGNLFGVRPVSLNEGALELLYEAMRLDISDVETDNKMNRIAYAMTRRCASKKDYAMLERMEKDGLAGFVVEYGRKNFKDKKEFVQEHLGDSADPITFLSSRQKLIGHDSSGSK